MSFAVSVAQDRKTARHLERMTEIAETDEEALLYARNLVGKLLRANGLPETSKSVLEVIDRFIPEHI